MSTDIIIFNLYEHTQKTTVFEKFQCYSMYYIRYLNKQITKLLRVIKYKFKYES